jgi:hypothetical protein
MAKEINLNLKKEEMDTIINQQKAEQAQVQPQQQQSKQQADIQQIVQGMQMQEMQLRLNLMREELISKQVSNIVTINSVVNQIADEAVSNSLKTLLSGYAVDESK